MPATTLTTIEAGFRTAIEAITPRYEYGSAQLRWKYVRDHARKPSTGARWFSMEWDTVGHTPNGFMGPVWVDTTATLSMRVDYGSVPRDVLKRMAEDDYYQLRDVLNAAKEVSIGGLRWVEPIDWDFAENVDQNQAQILYQFTIRYMQERA